MVQEVRGVIYYTDSRLKDPILSEVQKHILASGMPVTSSSLAPMDFGVNEVIKGVRGYPTMVKQIISCLERSNAKYVFFCEHDVLYDKSHFYFLPPMDDIFYYNENVWRWLIGDNKVIKHDRMLSLSNMCVNRKFALEHYRLRAKVIRENGWDDTRRGEPNWVRKMGYEPGTKKKRRGGITDDDFDTWVSNEPNIDIRHKNTFSSPKVKKEDFKHAPKWWEEAPVEEIANWNLKGIFK